jgi:hypothetical protein
MAVLLRLFSSRLSGDDSRACKQCRVDEPKHTQDDRRCITEPMKCSSLSDLDGKDGKDIQIGLVMGVG